MRPTTTQVIANQVENDPVRLIPDDCPSCGPSRPIRTYLDRRQCGHCGFLIAPERK